MRILIAEDDTACRLILRKAVEKLGHECVQAEDGQRAWEMFQEYLPDAVISDWMMPGLDGPQLCEKVRSHAAKAYTYFIILTALNDKESIFNGLESGADDYLCKPLDRNELQARLITGARVTELHRQLADQKLELERLNKELFAEGRLDPLTRVGNRRRMHEDLEALVHRAIRYGQGFSIGLCDIDHFKKYNDVCGHTAGDDALAAVAGILASHGRRGDVAYRYGGEEFLIVLPQQPVETAVVAIERRRSAVEKLSMPHPGAGEGAVLTISGGVATYQASDGESFGPLIERADYALYAAKEDGRNAVVDYGAAAGRRRLSVA